MVGSCKTAVGSGLASLLLASWQQLGWFSKVGGGDSLALGKLSICDAWGVYSPNLYRANTLFYLEH